MWMKKGFTLLLGVATLIGHFTGKAIDFVVKCAYCKECEVHEKDKGTTEHEAWLENHADNCCVNHEGSAEKMESGAMVEMFKIRETACLPRQNSEENMYLKYVQKRICHKISTDEKLLQIQHLYCPPGSSSWYTWQRPKDVSTLMNISPSYQK